MNGDETWSDDPLSHDGGDSADPHGEVWGADQVHPIDDPMGLGDHLDHVEQPDYLDHGVDDGLDSDGTDQGVADPLDHGFAADYDDHPVVVDGDAAEPEPVTAFTELPQPADASPFPPPLDLDVVPPDGSDWVDPGLLGEPSAEWGAGVDPAPFVAMDDPHALLADLHAADLAEGEPSWDALAGSDDPAIRALALHWASAG